MLVWEEHHDPQAEKPNTYLKNDQVLTYYILFKLVFTWLSVEQSSDWKRQRNTLFVADKQVLATVDAKIKPELLG